MESKTFGRRGLNTRASVAANAPARGLRSERLTDNASIARSTSVLSEQASTFDQVPLVTIALAIAFFIGYAMQARLALRVQTDGKFDLSSLVAMGAVGYNQVVLKGEWWRIFLAPLLHASISHQIGNTVALVVAGFRLEPMVGRAWFLTIFCLSALGGVAGSLMGNPHMLVTVGASGGISGLLGALLVASFHHKADELSDRLAMQRTALRFGIPALLPMLFNVRTGVDYYAHAGGAVTGALIALILCAFWPGDARRPIASFAILLVPAAYFSLATIGAGYAAQDYDSHRLDRDDSRADLMSDSDLPKAFKLKEPEAAALVGRFPNDPRAHLLHGVSLASVARYGAAEYEFRAALDRFKPNDGLPGRDLTVALLAFDLAAQGRKLDARDVAAPLCAATSRPSDIETLLTKSQVCEPLKR